MKIFLISLITALVTALLVVQFAGTGGAKSEGRLNKSFDHVMATRTLRCAYATWPPSVLMKDPNTGAFSGILPELFEMAGKNLNLKIEWTEETGYGPQAIEGLKAGRFDAFCGGMNQNAQRGQHVLFTNPIFFNPIYAYVRGDDHRFDKTWDIINDPQYTLSVMDGEATDTIAKNRFPNAKTFSLPQNSEMAMLYANVAHNKADLVFSDVSRADEYIKNNPGKLRRANDNAVLTYTISIPVSNEEPKLKAMLDAAFMELHGSGQTKAIVQKYDPKLDGNKVLEFYYAK